MRSQGTIVLLIGLGVVLVVIGTQRWLDQRAASAVVEQFVTAVQQGDRETILRLLRPEHRRLVEHGESMDPTQFAWDPEPNVSFRWHQIQISGDEGQAEVVLERDGFRLKPVIRLHRSETGQWKIGGLENLRPDPRWEEAQREYSRSEGEQLADELRQALEQQPGIAVERVPLDENH